MRFGSVCSGIEAASVAWCAPPLDWECAWVSERLHAWVSERLHAAIRALIEYEVAHGGEPQALAALAEGYGWRDK